MALFQTAQASSVATTASALDALWHPDTSPPISSSAEAVRAATVAVARDMEFIGRGGVLMPELSELRKFIRNCVPHIVRGEYIDSYFINQDHGKIFWKLRGRGFKSDDAMMDEALAEVEPIYEAIMRSLTGQSATTSATQAQAQPVVEEKPQLVRAMNSQDAALFARFNVLAQRYGADAADVLAELRYLAAGGCELAIVQMHGDAKPSVERLATHAEFVLRGSEYVLAGRDVRDLLHRLAVALNQNTAASVEQLRRSN